MDQSRVSYNDGLLLMHIDGNLRSKVALDNSYFPVVRLMLQVDTLPNGYQAIIVKSRANDHYWVIMYGTVSVEVGICTTR